MYNIVYLPLAKQDLEQIVDYISYTLEAPQAALHLLQEIEDAIMRLRSFPYAHRLYHPLKPINLEYRIMKVKHYLIFYVVLDTVVEIHRIIHNKRNIEEALNPPLAD